MKKIVFIKDYLTYPEGKVMDTTVVNGEKLISKGFAKWVEEKEETEKPKRKRRTKAEMQEAIENKAG